ncbi:exodeoxyribonuclease I, partial [Lelliottia sp. V106_10]|uniref:exodeoxyribonuclease I n=1 Tax=Lelliottia wanjuensis TaxID=3050585 RepID=UPI00254D22AC
RGVNEAEFANRIHALFSEPGTCVVGYNNVRFDDEVTRNIFYRNFIDPYGWSWQNGNSRWDLLDVMRACYALRPEGINWLENDEGLPSFRLEHLTKANGVAHEQAHDAMSDVYATIAMAKLVKATQPRLFEFLLSHRNKNKLSQLIDVPQMKPLVHVSGMFGALRGNTSWIVPLAWHPENRNAVITCDLAGDITPLLALEADALRERLYTPKADLGSLPAVPI